MNRSKGTLSRSLAIALSAGAVAVICLVGSPVKAQDAPPPPEVIATLTPVYHEGHAAYWYNGYWHYRDHGNWAYYHTEPAFFHDWRGHHPNEWHHYGRR
jgi:hypothetical protein